MNKISLVIPVYNESHRLSKTVKTIKKYLDNQHYQVEVLIVIEKSADNSLLVAQKATRNDSRFRVINNKVHKGKGYAVRKGVLSAKGKYIFFMDADLSTDLRSINQFIDFFKTHSKTQIIIGSRSHPESVIRVKQGLVRQAMGKIYNFFTRAFLLADFQDTQCGFKAFRQEAAHVLFRLQKTNGFAFDVEVLLIAKKIGYKTSVLPVVWANHRFSKVKILKSSAQMIVDLYKIRKLWSSKQTEKILAWHRYNSF